MSSDANPFRYSGEYFDAETGDYYLRARYYNPRLGRFLTEDPAHDGNNWYVYCNNNPVKYVDPSGKIAVVDDALVTLVLVTGAIVTVTAEWLASPEGQTALNNGAKIFHDAAQTLVEGVQAGIEAVGEYLSDAADAVSEAANAVGNWLADTFGGGGSPNPNKPDDDKNNQNNKENKESSKRQDENQKALHDPAKEAKKNGDTSYEEAEILKEWAKEYDVPNQGIEVHPNRPGPASNIPHIHIGKIGHIPVVGDVPPWLMR